MHESFAENHRSLARTPLAHPKIVPITNLIGLPVVLSEITHGDIGIGTHVYVVAGVLALAGFVLGFTNWALDVPPKFFRTKSRVS